MKKIFAAAIVTVATFFAGHLIAANSVNVSGDLAVDGYLTIDINWMVDTAKYTGAAKDDIRKQVHDDIWEAVMPKLARYGNAISKCSTTNFTKVAEQKKLLKSRKNGTKVYDYVATMRFECVQKLARPMEGGPTNPEAFTEGFHDGFTDEANAF